jgi:phenylpyruvate tautomerase PptA (4-oxalocrotonate tautomerase family)
VSAMSINAGERIRSFQMIKRCEDQLSDCSDQLIKKLFKVHMDNLNDSNQSIVVAVEDSLLNLIQYQNSLVDKYLDQIIPIVSYLTF